VIVTARGPVTIRTGVEEDADAYRELRLEALQNHPEVYSSDYDHALSLPMAYWVERLRAGGTGDVAQMYFAAYGQELVGLCGIYRADGPRTRHSANVVSLYVRPPWRGLGIAAALVTACLDWARSHDVRIVKLGVITTNAPAIAVYERCGFRTYGTEPQAIFYDGVFYDEMLMARPVGQGGLAVRPT
jgi:RimJ/RimL family protein N-acetyltransferase